MFAYRSMDERQSVLAGLIRIASKKDVTPQVDESLFDPGLLDSFALPDLVSAIEREFHISIPDSDLNPKKPVPACHGAILARKSARVCGRIGVLWVSRQSSVIDGLRGASLKAAARSVAFQAAMPVFVPAFFEERQPGCRRGNLKGYATVAP
jgi:acyl carrier protein